jgi:hypothetical protein
MLELAKKPAIYFPLMRSHLWTHYLSNTSGFLIRWPKKVMRLLHSRMRHLVFVVIAACSLAYGQGCEDFSLEAEASSNTVEPSKPFSIELTLANQSQGTVTVFAPHLPTGWAIYEKSGSRWVHVWGQTTGRRVASEKLEESGAPSEKFPADEYVRVAPGGTLKREVDFAEAIWGPRQLAVKYKTNSIRVFFTYSYEARSEEGQLNMLQCHLRSDPVELTLVTTKQSGNKKRTTGGNGSQ